MFNHFCDDTEYVCIENTVCTALLYEYIPCSFPSLSEPRLIFSLGSRETSEETVIGAIVGMIEANTDCLEMHIVYRYTTRFSLPRLKQSTQLVLVCTCIVAL